MNRSLTRLIITYALITTTIYLCESVSFWFYPIAIVVLASQYLTLVLLGHEGVHGLLHTNRFVNRTLARYLCHFPFLISHTHYSMNHLRHHRNLGTSDDPDVNIYQNAYPSISSWVSQSFFDTLNLSILKKFLNYFNGAPSYLSGHYPFKIKTDYLELLIFWIVLLGLVFTLKFQVSFILYWFLPLFITLPWFLVMNSYQHYSEDGVVSGRAYTILFKNPLIKELLFPINVNYHETHHQRPDVPYFKLPRHYVKSNNSVSFTDFSKRVFNSQKSRTL